MLWDCCFWALRSCSCRKDMTGHGREGKLETQRSNTPEPSTLVLHFSGLGSVSCFFLEKSK